jgi:hypothetical protein
MQSNKSWLERIKYYFNILLFSPQQPLPLKPRYLLLPMVVVILLGLTLAMFADVIFTTQSIFLSHPSTDLCSQFIYWRLFGATQIKQGNLPLWNPQVFSGTPFFAMFQSALLYPPNIVYLFFSLPKAINLDIAINIFLSGLFTYLWTSYRRLHPLSCLLVSILQMFCSARFLHIYAGHLEGLASMTWAPLIFLSIDGLIMQDKIRKCKSWAWVLLGIFAVAMQGFAGHPQYFVYTAIAVGFYVGFELITTPGRIRILGQVISMYIGAMALVAVQFLPGFLLAEESVRGGGVAYEYAAMFSFPPENLITLLAPKFFGNETTVPYWGRCYLWEMVFFISVTGFFLALYGAMFGDKNKRRYLGLTITLLLLLALGNNTFFFRFFYDWLPGLNRFRGPSKFIFPASLFLTFLAGVGLDTIIGNNRVNRKVILGLLLTAIGLSVFALLIHISAASDGVNVWQNSIHLVNNTHESYLSSQLYQNRDFIERSGSNAANTLLIAAGFCIVLALLFELRKYMSLTIILIVFLSIAEILVFARGTRPTTSLSTLYDRELARLTRVQSGEFRLLNLVNPNSGMYFGLNEIWGYQSLILKRYAEFIAFTQGQSPEQVTSSVSVTKFSRLFSFLRCRYVYNSIDNRNRLLESTAVLPRAFLVHEYSLIKDRSTIFSILTTPAFDPTNIVILEEPPNPPPEKSGQTGVVSIQDISTDELMVELELTSPAILVITDSYSKGWRVNPLPGSAQTNYQLLPADYVLRAIPVSAGKHRFILEYAPIGYRIGKWISIISLIIYLAIVGALLAASFARKKIKPFSQ